MKRLLMCSTLLASGFVFAPNEAMAQTDPCDEFLGNNTASRFAPNDPDVNTDNFGVRVRAQARAVPPTSCDYYITNNDTGFQGRFTGESKDSYNASSSYNYPNHPAVQTVQARAGGSISDLTLSGSFNVKNPGSGVRYSQAWMTDTIVIDNSVGSTGSGQIEVCAEYSTPYSGASVNTAGRVDLLDKQYRSLDFFLPGETSTRYLGYSVNASSGPMCTTATFDLDEAQEYFSFFFDITPGWTNDAEKNDVNSYDYAATSSATITFSLPTGVTCESYSGKVPGCRSKYEPDDNMCVAAGNPINYVHGYKYENEADYSGGRLSFNRMYRSDMNWTNDVIGKRWRHNFYRNMEIHSDPEKITLTDGMGGRKKFLLSDLGVWESDEDNTTESVVDWMDSTTHVGYIYTTDADTNEYYDLDGMLVRIEYVGSESLDLVYDVNDRLTSVTNEQAKSISFTYDGSDRIATAVTPDGTYTYAYDTNSNLTSVTKPDTTTRIYHYEDTRPLNKYALTGVTDERGTRLSTFGYDDKGRAVSSEHIGDTNEFTFAYGEDTTTVTNALGKDTIYTFEDIAGERKVVDVQGVASANCVAANKDYTYDTNGFVTSKTDWAGTVTNYTRNDLGLATNEVEAAGTAAERTKTTSYKAGTRLPTEIIEDGLTTQYVYDGDDRMTSMTVIDQSGGSRTTSYTYHANTTDSNGNTVLGRLASQTDPRSNTTSYTYDANNRLIKTANALGHEYETTSFDSADRPLIVVDENGVETRFTYDVQGRMTSMTEGFGTSEAQTTDYSYNADGQLFEVTPENDAWTKYYYNDRGLRRSMRNHTDGTWWTYDDAGNVATETRKKIASGTPNSYGHYWFYDELSRVRYERTTNWWQKTNFTHDVNSNVTSMTDANGNATSYTYDALNRRTGMTDALSGTTSYSLNDLGYTESVTNARGHTTSYNVNAFGEDTSETSPDRGAMTYVRDAVGNITQMTDARGEVTNYTYDAINRLTAVSYPSDASLNVSMSYDSCTYGVGRLCSVTDASGTTAYTYDALGRLAQAVETRGTLSFTTAYDYDSAGVLNSITLPSGRVVTHGLDDNAQIESITANVGGATATIIDNAEYLAFGPLSAMDYGNGKSLSNTYDLDHRMTGRTITGGTMSYSYTHDDNGNITAKGATSYTYDDLDRLTDEDGDTYAYDATHNRTSGKTVTYGIDANSNRVTAIGGASVTTDAAGQITAQTVSGTPLTYAYDAAGRIETVSDSSGVLATYTYDAQNLRTKKVVTGGATTHYVYGAGGLLSGEYDNTGTLIREYVYHYGEPVAQIDAGVSETLTYLHTDHLGTPRKGSNASGSNVWSWDSDAFGVGAPTGSQEVNLRFAGQYFDAESDLHYNWNRYYNPATGRYVSSDPIGLSGGINTYGYVEANPVMYVDPKGLAVFYGRMRTYSVGQFAGATWATLWLHTNDNLSTVDFPCIDIKVDLLGGGVSLGGPASRTYDYVRIDTGRGNYDINALSGHWTFAGGGVRSKDRGGDYGILRINDYVVETLEDRKKNNIQATFAGGSAGASSVTILGRQRHNPLP